MSETSPGLDQPHRGLPLMLLGLAVLAVLLIAQAAALRLPDREPALAEAEAIDAASMKPYRERLAGTDVGFDMVPIPGGTFLIGSPESEAGRQTHEGPQSERTVEPFWMGVHEVTWDEYRQFQFRDQEEPGRERVEGLSRPTPPYVPMDFGMGTSGFPAISMTQFAARQYTQWLSYRTGRFYRLPTEAEWEWACRAGTQTPFSFGEFEPQTLDRHAWSWRNSDDRYHPVATLAANPYGLFDMHGNVAEWTLDRLAPYETPESDASSLQVAWPTAAHPRAVRGGSFRDDPEDLRCAARRGSKESWKKRDPQLPKSVWYLTDARFVGFRVVRPLRQPTAQEAQRFWQADSEEIRDIVAAQDARAKGL
jgi:formylglycine-generating enzyme required for sulfatase activity